MAENKQYITQVQEKGTVMISEEVVAAIAAQAIMEVEGVLGIGSKPGADRKLWGKGLKITITENNDVTIDCGIVVAYDNPVVNIGKSVQAAVSGAVESMTGVKPAAVNVSISGIVRQ